MKDKNLSVDLHLHTNFSDGIYSPQELINKALEKNLRAIAITDHDTVEGIMPATTAGLNKIEVVPGIELSTKEEGIEYHILGYYIHFQQGTLIDFLKKMQEERRKRAEKILQCLQNIGLPIRKSEKLILEKNSPGRMHIAQALEKEGYVKDWQEAFQRYLNPGCVAYVPRHRVTPEEAIDLIKKAGGISVLAHPGDLPHREKIYSLIPRGLQGLEVIHPHHTAEEQKKFLSLARNYSLIPTGGSDCHGPIYNGQSILGAYNIPYRWLETLQKAKRELKGEPS